MTAPKSRLNAWYAKPARIVRVHVKLVASALVGIALFLILPGELHASTRALIAWNAAVVFYLAVAAYVLTRSELGHLRKRAAEEDEGAALILALTVSAAVASLVAIFVELGSARDEQLSNVSAILAVSTVVLSWVFMVVSPSGR